MKDKRFALALLGTVITVSVILWKSELIHGGDVVLNIIAIIAAWIACAVPWSHDKWSRSDDHGWPKAARTVYWTAAIIMFAIPILSSLGSMLMTYAPMRLDQDMTAVVNAAPPPPTIIVTSVARSTSPQMSAFVPPATGTYVAVGTPTSVVISPTTPVLQRIAGDIDANWRIQPAWSILVILLILLLLLWMLELASDWRTTTSSSAQQPAVEAAKPAG